MSVSGEPSGAWALDLPAEEVPAELPEPCLGINFARDGMARKEWLALVAVHSDAWLMSVAFYYGAKLNSDQRCASDQTSTPRYALTSCFSATPASCHRLIGLSDEKRRCICVLAACSEKELGSLLPYVFLHPVTASRAHM